jgi:hypothetical protein
LENINGNKRKIMEMIFGNKNGKMQPVGIELRTMQSKEALENEKGKMLRPGIELMYMRFK